MRTEQVRRIEMLTRVRDFGESRAALFPPSSHGGQLFGIVSAVCNELATLAGHQASMAGAAREKSARKGVARAALSEAVEKVHLTARAMSLTTPGLDKNFRLPVKHNDQALLAAARAFADVAVAWKPQFILRDLPETFIEDLLQRVEDFEQALRERNVRTGLRVAATTALAEAIERGFRAAQELNAIVKNKLQGDKPELSAWASARHEERASQRRSSPTPGAPPPEPSTSQSRSQEHQGLSAG